MNEFLPLILLFLFGGFAVVTALLKTRARVRSPLGVVLTFLEGISGLVLMGSALPGAGSLGRASWIAIVVAGLVAASSTVHLLTVRERSRAREASTGNRLAAAIEYPVGDAPATPGDDVSAEPRYPAEPDVTREPGDAT
jgi:hypothetical protein